LLRAMSSSASARGAASTMALPDSILITQLAVRMHVGVDGWERLQAQPVNIDARVHTDVSQAGRSDHLPHSIHYGILVKELEKHCAENRYRSLEALAVSACSATASRCTA
jgi:dihydroneopterin aldolase/2-amino-4-hydroxy-6-hydroxymethyldihydropteridine diphosphokinase/dihydropteroate synthase/2-amino-4-hydroxy-6-hydroxymethyldihydropteridine diphosphokinase/dihydropteroate synthase